MLFTSETKVVSVLIFDLKESGDLGAIAVLGLSMLVLTFAVVIARQPHPRLRRRPPAQHLSPGMSGALPAVSVAEHLAERIAALDAARLPAAVRAQMRGPADRRGRALRHRAQRGLRQGRARRLDDDGPCTAIGHARTLERGRRGLRQRHRGAWRGFRRHLRGRAGACRRGDRAGGAGGLRAAQAGRHARRCSASPSASRCCAG